MQDAAPPPITDDDFPDDAQPAQTHRFPSHWIGSASVDLTSRPLVKGLLEESSFNVIYGASGSGKSFATADLCQHIAQGKQWRGRATRQCLVVYVASEAGASILKRFVGWRDNVLGDAADTSPQAIPLAILTRGPNLLDADGIKDLALHITELEAACGHKCGLVVFDTLSRSIPGGDENSAKDMTSAVKAADRLREVFGCATIYVHHSGKDADKGARGHSSLFAACDLVIQVSKLERAHAAKVEKVRDGVSGETFAFCLLPVDLGEDPDGDMLKTCIVETADASTAPKDPLRRMGKNQRVVYPLLQALMASKAQFPPETSAIPKGVRAVTFTDLCDAAMPKFPGKEPRRVREAVSQVVTDLQAAKIIGVHNDLLWIL